MYVGSILCRDKVSAGIVEELAQDIDCSSDLRGRKIGRLRTCIGISKTDSFSLRTTWFWPIRRDLSPRYGLVWLSRAIPSWRDKCNAICQCPTVKLHFHGWPRADNSRRNSRSSFPFGVSNHIYSDSWGTADTCFAYIGTIPCPSIFHCPVHTYSVFSKWGWSDEASYCRTSVIHVNRRPVLLRRVRWTKSMKQRIICDGYHQSRTDQYTKSELRLSQSLPIIVVWIKENPVIPSGPSRWWDGLSLKEDIDSWMVLIDLIIFQKELPSNAFMFLAICPINSHMSCLDLRKHLLIITVTMQVSNHPFVQPWIVIGPENKTIQACPDVSHPAFVFIDSINKYGSVIRLGCVNIMPQSLARCHWNFVVQITASLACIRNSGPERDLHSILRSVTANKRFREEKQLGNRKSKGLNFCSISDRL